MQEKPTTTLCIFVKPPTAGRVKTRLVPSVTPAQAAELASAFFADTLALARSCDWARIVVACDGDPALLALDTDVEVWPQGGGDLGERMERVLGRALGDLARLAELLREERIFAPRTARLLAGATGPGRPS